MEILRAYKTELDPNNVQRTALLKHAGAARFAFNWALARRKQEYEETGKSSKLCRFCGCINSKLKLSDRQWTCDCGAVFDRDLNAAINLKNLALRRVPPEEVCIEQTNACGEERLQPSGSAPHRNRNQTLSLPMVDSGRF